MTRTLRFAAIPVFLLLVRLVACGKSNSSPTAPGVAMTPTVPSVGATATPLPAATPTAPPAAAHNVTVGAGGGNTFRDSQSGGSTTTIRAGETVTWTWAAGPHSTTSGTCCSASGMWDSGVKSSGSFSRMFPAAGTFPYFCTVHGSAMTGTVMVTP